MIAIVKGEFLSRRTGKSGDGKDYDFTTILSGDETVQITGYDPGAAVKRMDPVQVLCELRRSKDGRLFVNFIKN